jgi:hypothetical protein
MINNPQNIPLVSIARNRSCKLNQAAVRLINSRHGERYKLIRFGSETRLLKTDAGEFEARKYANENWSIGGVKLIQQLGEIFPHVRKFIIEPVFENQFNIKPYQS